MIDNMAEGHTKSHQDEIAVTRALLRSYATRGLRDDDAAR